MSSRLHPETRPQTRDAESWIQCRGVLRDSGGGFVDCPLQGVIQAAECLDCHFLETLSNERSRRTSCQLPDDI